MMNSTTLSSNDDVIDFLDLQWQIAGVDHYDIDGKCDILWRNSSTGENVLWLMDGASVSSTATLPEVTDAQWEIKGHFQTLSRGNGISHRKMVISAPAKDMEILPPGAAMDMKN